MFRILSLILGSMLLLLAGIILLPRQQEPQTPFMLVQSDREGNYELYRIRLDGSDVQNLTNSPWNDYFASFTPDGQGIIFLSDRDGNGELYRVSLDGRDVQNLTNSPAEEYFVSFTPDKKGIIFWSWLDGISNRELYQVQSDGSGLQNLTNDPAYDEFIAFTPIIDLPWQPGILFLGGLFLCAYGSYLALQQA